MNNASKIIIIGATGYIGNYLFQSGKTKRQILGTSSSSKGMIPLCLNSPSDFDYSVIEPNDYVIMLAAISSPDVCANEYNRAWSLNVTGTSKFIAKALALGARVIFFSSDTVYGDQSEPFESAVSQPLGEYALMKSKVENLFLSNPNFKTIRLSYVFSKEDKFTSYLISCAKNSEVAEIYHPFFRAIIHRDDVIDGVFKLVDHWDMFAQSVINFGGPEVLSRVEFAEIMKRNVLPDLRFRVVDLGVEFFKSRPRVIRMNSSCFTSLLGREAKTIDAAIDMEFRK